jgi:sugar/nucleoside kinase (ribokinase family)
MDNAGLSFLPHADDPLDAELREVDVAIAMVVRGAAVRVRLVGLNGADHIAPIALARAQEAGVDFHVDHTGTATRLTFGPSD